MVAVLRGGTSKHLVIAEERRHWCQRKGKGNQKSDRAFYRMERNQKHTLSAAGIFERTFQGKNSTLWGSYKKRKTLQMRKHIW